jgi:hypothetical protein
VAGIGEGHVTVIDLDALEQVDPLQALTVKDQVPFVKALSPAMPLHEVERPKAMLPDTPPGPLMDRL